MTVARTATVRSTAACRVDKEKIVLLYVCVYMYIDNNIAEAITLKPIQYNE